MAPGAVQKPPPPPTGDQLVSWSQLYRYMDNPVDVMLFSLAIAGSLGSGARSEAGTRVAVPSAFAAAAAAHGSALPRHAADA